MGDPQQLTSEAWALCYRLAALRARTYYTSRPNRLAAEAHFARLQRLEARATARHSRRLDAWIDSVATIVPEGGK